MVFEPPLSDTVMEAEVPAAFNLVGGLTVTPLTTKVIVPVGAADA
jgi:hypothetical protein